MPTDTMAIVVKPIEQGKYRLVETLPIFEAHIWQNVTAHSKVEKLILERNKRHLQQTDIEGGVKCEPISNHD